MVDWKERGYVPDSDDSDEDVREEIGSNPTQEHQIDTQIGHSSIPTHPKVNSLTAFHNGTASNAPAGDDFLALEDSGGEKYSVQQSSSTNPASSIANRLEAELNRGIQLTQDVLGSFIDRDDATDSPLSSPPASLPDSPRQDAPGVRTSSLTSVGASNPDVLAAGQTLTSMPPLGRSFRRRAPIQLHPYALEDAKYRQSLKDRGLKPVRTFGPAQDPQNSAQGDSQSVDAPHSSQMDESYDQSPCSSPMMQDVADESQSLVQATRIPIPDVDLGEDLPELNDILHSSIARPPGVAAVIRKRLHQSKKASRIAIHDGYHIYDLPVEENESAEVSRRTRPMFRVPPSPPRSRDDLSSQGAVNIDEDQHSQSGTTLFSIPTPLLSSGTRAKRRLQRSASLSSRVSTSFDISDDPSASALSEHSGGDSQGVQRLQRKIKGVLPASWLKLDQKKQRDIGKQTQKPSHSPVKFSVEKGVAKHVSGSITRTMHGDSTRSALDDFDLLSESENESDNNKSADFGDGLNVEARFDSFMDDVVEDNAVDAMIPPRSRNNPRIKKQQKLRDVWANPSNISLDSGVSSHSHHSAARKTRPKARGGAPPRKRLKQSHAKPQMTVLDAPGFEEPEIPRFLRIAARPKKTSNRPPGQDQSTKFFKLATKQDTLDVRAGLAQWKPRRTQRYLMRPSNNVPHSQPLISQPRPQPDLSVTEQNDNDITHLTLLKQNTEATLKRVHLNQIQRDVLYSQPPLHHQPPSNSLAEYFRPRPTLSGHSSRRQSFDPIKRSHTQSESSANPPKQLPLPRRVPRNTSTAWDSSKQQNQRSTPNPSSTTRPPQSSCKHRPRKQRPTALMASQALLHDLDNHNDTTHGADEIKTSPFTNTSLKPFTEDGILAHLMGHAPGNKPLSKEGCLSSSHLWDSGILQRTVEAMGDLGRLLEPSNSTTKVIKPDSGQTMTLGSWSLDVDYLMFELCSVIVRITEFNPATVQIQALTISSWRDNRSACNATQRHHQLMTRCQESLETLIEYINDTLCFASRGQIDDFIKSGISMVERIVQEINFQEHAKVGVTASHLLNVFNRVILFSYQVTKIAEYSSHDESSTKQALIAHDSLTRLAWSIALREDHAGHLFSFLQGLTTISAIGKTSPGAEIETIIIVHQLFPGNVWEVYMDQFLVQKFKEPDACPGEMLAYTVLVLGCVYCLFGIEQEDHEMDGQNTKPPKEYGLISLQKTLPVFLKFYLDVKHNYHGERKRSSTRNLRDAEGMNKLAQYGLVAFKWCFLLVSTIGRHSADQLLKKILKCYGDNKMHDLFSREPSHAMPAFLAQQIPPSELVLDFHDKDFHIFLKFVASSLVIHHRPSEGENSYRLRKLAARKQSLVFSLLPNNAFQVKDEEALTLRDLAAVANRYNLFSTLYHYSPSGYKPPLVNIENLIVFSESHEAVCNLALQCWASIGRSAIAQGENDAGLTELCRWIQDMFVQVTKKLASIPYNGEGSFPEQRVNSVNRETATRILCTIAQTWTDVIELCPSKIQAQLLINPDGVFSRIFTLEDILQLCRVNPGLPDHVIVEVLNVVRSYLKKPSDHTNHLCEEWLQSEIQSIIRYQFDQRVLPTDDLLVALVDTWYELAKTLVDDKVFSWDDYLNPASKLSFVMMMDFPTWAHCEALFLNKALMHKACFETDRFGPFQIWLSSMLLPKESPKFENTLTSRLVEIAPDTLDLADLAVGLYRETSLDIPANFPPVVKHRLEIVLHIIRSVHKHHSNKDNSTVGVLSKSQTLELLRTIQNVLSWRWRWMKNSDLKAEWAVFINEVVLEMTLYPVEGNEIDEWMTSSEIRGFEHEAVQVRRVFAKAFAQGRTEVNAVDDFKRCVHAFRAACEALCIKNSSSFGYWHTKATFRAIMGECIDGKGNYQVNIQAQTQFLKAVLPVYITKALDDTTPAMLFAVPTLEIANRLMLAVELRFDFHDVVAMESFAELAVMLLRASYLCLKGQANKFEKPHDWEVLTILRTIESVAVAAMAWGRLKLAHAESESIASLQTQVQTYVCFTYEYMVWIWRLSVPYIDAEYTTKLSRLAFTRRADEDFGFYMPYADPGATEELESLREIAGEDLEFAARSVWHRTKLDQFRGPGWRYKGVEEEVFAVAYELDQELRLANAVLGSLLSAMEFLGLREPEAWRA
ncbi:uncharacterized protein A1O9_05778 [Exophiala aquamarina CBS 119918]|uniref:Uncharacterized protein n=1 Tax=Exophiala aquamarina CBS 119918 TaxID=1182545 RepID=A0A072PDN1_9EURO|nr:uncharacterized protein A1O9_05778 [Exophiala aquamarina CBS 119918]KEF57857.1 hypothetical protein A1O9_05778 [Exophiala aquamarina CBS 119918]